MLGWRISGPASETILASAQQVYARGRTHSYTYRSVTGAVERNEACFDGDWLGSISVCSSALYRIRLTVENFICKQFQLPTTVADLEKFIAGRPDAEKKCWYTVGMTNPKTNKTKTGGICLPYLMSFLELSEKSLEERKEAVISNVTVAPHHQKKGVGTMLHLFLAQHLRDEGFEKLVSDLVGMNTSGELAIWKRLQAQGHDIAKLEPMSHSCVPRLLHSIKILDDVMYKEVNRQGSHFGDGVCTFKKMEKIDFPQYEWDLAKPILTEE